MLFSNNICMKSKQKIKRSHLKSKNLKNNYRENLRCSLLERRNLKKNYRIIKGHLCIREMHNKYNFANRSISQLHNQRKINYLKRRKSSEKTK